jgi:hypothetical protein
MGVTFLCLMSCRISEVLSKRRRSRWKRNKFIIDTERHLPHLNWFPINEPKFSLALHNNGQLNFSIHKSFQNIDKSILFNFLSTFILLHISIFWQIIFSMPYNSKNCIFYNKIIHKLLRYLAVCL